MRNRREFLKFAVLSLAASAAMPMAMAAETSSLEEVKKRGALRIGVTPSDPWFFKDPMSQKWMGVGVMIGDRMAKQLGVQLATVETTWANSVAAIQAGQIDLMFVLDPTEERKKAIAFPDNPLFYYAMGALIHDDMKVAEWQDLNKEGMRVGVTLGTTVDRKLTAELPKAKIERFASNDEAIAAFVSRRVDAVSQFHPALIVQVSRIGTGKVVLPKKVYAVPTSVGLRKAEDPSFKEWVNDFIGRIYNDGTTGDIFREYIATKGIDPKSVPGIVREEWF